jgi:hypothetical protein
VVGGLRAPPPLTVIALGRGGRRDARCPHHLPALCHGDAELHAHGAEATQDSRRARVPAAGSGPQDTHLRQQPQRKWTSRLRLKHNRP